MVGFEFSLGILEPPDCRRQTAIDESQFEAECLTARIEQAVWHATAAAVKNLRVQLHDEQVILTGRCRTYYTKQIAQHAAMEAAAGWEVFNQIVVT
jgi:osmotically-inducible protein OsmY